MANYLCNNRDFQGAITHIKEAFEIADILHYDTERTYLNTFLGSVYESTGQSSLAEGYYKVAMKISEGTTPSDIAYAGIKYAIFFKNQTDVTRKLSTLQKCGINREPISFHNISGTVVSARVGMS